MVDLTASIAIGAEAERTIMVTPELTVAHAYPGLPAVYATPQMIALMEMAAADAIAALLPPGWVSVGTHIDVRHLAATPLGMQVVARARVIEVSARAVRFAVSAHDGVEGIGEGFHIRSPIARSRCNEGVARKIALSGARA